MKVQYSWIKKFRLSRKAYKHKKWAFVMDCIQLKVLCEYDGIYMDIDGGVIRPFDPFLKNSAFICFGNYKDLSTGVIAAEPRNKWIGEMLKIYERMHFEIGFQQFLVRN